MVIPTGVRLDVPEELKSRTVYVENDCRDIWEWSEKVYGVIEKRERNDHSEKI
jgi:hypothetical protein